MAALNSLSNEIARLCSADTAARAVAAQQIYALGKAAAESATRAWFENAELSRLLYAKHPEVTVGLAVHRETFAQLRSANGSPRMAIVPPEQDAEEFELHFPEAISLDILTTRDPAGAGAIARYLSKLGEGIQQVEFHCADVDAATSILQNSFGLTPVYSQSHGGADGTRINFFLMPIPEGGKILIELWEKNSV